MRRLLPLLVPFALAACQSGTEPAPGGVTADEAQALNEAAEMLDRNSVAAAAPDNVTEAP